MAQLPSLTVNDTGYLALPSGTSAQRPSLSSLTTIRWTNTGSQAYSVLAGTTPTLTNTSWTAPTGITSIEVLVVAGGGGGPNFNPTNNYGSGGGGGGGVIYSTSYSVVPGTAYTVTVGAGGAAQGTNGIPGNNGNNSVFGSLTAIGGGGGGRLETSGASGGSGGGAGGHNSISTPKLGGAGTLGQGHKGGDQLSQAYAGGGGGGGAGAAGQDNPSVNGGKGGDGLAFGISGTSTYYGGGGGGGASNSGNTPGAGGLGGGGTGSTNDQTSGGNGTASTGGGGGGKTGGSGGSNSVTSAGGSGVVIIRYSLTAAGTQEFGRTRINTESATVETFNFNNQWNSNNLILHIDAGNASSYSGSGSAWNDLSGNNNHGTLINSPTYTSSSGGYFTFNGTNQYSTFPIANNPDCYAFEIGIRQWKAVVNFPETDMGPNYSCVGITAQHPSTLTATQNGLNIGGWTGSMDRETISWWNYASGNLGACTIRADVSFVFHIYTINWNGTAYDIWLDGVKYPTFQRSLGAQWCYLLKNIQTVIPGYNSGFGYYFKGDIGHIKMFSKPLSDYAVTQSYLLNKTRYGL